MTNIQSRFFILFFILFLPILAFGSGSIYLVDNNRTYYSNDNGITVYYVDTNDNNMTYYTDDNGTTLYYKDEHNVTFYTDYNITVLYYKDKNGTSYYVDTNGTILYYKDKNGTEHYNGVQESIDVIKGRSVISGNIDISKLPDSIYAVWIVDGGNWYGYSPRETVRDAIKKKYRLMRDDKIIPAYKAIIVWADEDSSIKLESDNSIKNVTQHYGKNFTIHGANNIIFGAEDIACSDTNNSITALFKVAGDTPSVYVPNKEINSTENFAYVYSDEGYYVLCEQNLGGL